VLVPPVAPLESVQGDVNVPVPLVANPTVPVGVCMAPGEVSTTVAVQLVAVPSVAGELQATDVDVSLALTVIVTVLLVLPLCPPSPW